MGIAILSMIICVGCNKTQKETSAEGDANEQIDVDENDRLANNIIDLKGLYRLQPEDKSLSVDIKVDFKENNNLK